MEAEPTDEAMGLLVDEGTVLLKQYHEEHNKDPGSLATEFWRGNLAGFRHAVEAMFGTEGSSEILKRIRSASGLRIPHSGVKTADGYLGADFHADLLP